jgi:hypothetical protein
MARLTEFYRQQSPFFTLEMHVVIVRLCLLLPTPLALSLHGRPLLFRQQHSLSLLRRSLARSVCSDVPAGLSCWSPLAARALRTALNLSPQKAGAAAGWSAACATAKGASDVDRAILRALAAAATPPPILLLAAVLAS